MTDTPTQPGWSADDYRLVAETIPHLVWVASADGAIEYVNRRCLEYSGLAMTDLLGWDWERAIHPDDMPLTISRWSAALKHGTPHEVEYRLLRHDGEYRWHVARALPLRDADGRVVRWFGTCTDVDDLKRAEAALRTTEGLFRALVERSYEGFALLAPDWAVRYVSPAVTRVLGFTPAEFSGRDLLGWVHPDDRAGLSVWLGHLAGRAGAMVEVWYRFRHRDGTYRWLEVRATNRLYDPAVAAVVVNFRDITERRPSLPAQGVAPVVGA